MKNKSMKLGKTTYQIEETAHLILNDYLSDLKKHFKARGEQEAYMDIELRIAEIFSKKLDANKGTSIYIEDVKLVVQQIGTVEQFEGGEGNEKLQIYKTLFRNPDDRMFGGLAAGLAAYFSCNATVVRLLLIVITLGVLSVAFFIKSFLLALFPFIYLIACNLIPMARTTQEKLSMYEKTKAPKNTKIKYKWKNSLTLLLKSIGKIALIATISLLFLLFLASLTIGVLFQSYFTALLNMGSHTLYEIFAPILNLCFYGILCFMSFVYWYKLVIIGKRKVKTKYKSLFLSLVGFLALLQIGGMVLSSDNNIDSKIMENLVTKITKTVSPTTLSKQYYYPSIKPETDSIVNNKTYSITITTFVTNPSDEVYISGNQDCIGNWDGKGAKMEKISDFQRQISLEVKHPIEFKFTKGSWSEEAILIKDLELLDFTPFTTLSRDYFDNIELHLVEDAEYIFDIIGWQVNHIAQETAGVEVELAIDNQELQLNINKQ